MLANIGVRRTKHITDTLSYVVLTAVALVMVFPFAWMVLSSLKTVREIYAYPPRILPETFQWSNYLDAWRALPFDRFFLNSVLIAVATTVGTIVTCSMAGYSFARLRYPGRDAIFLVYLSTMTIPFPVLMIPLFIIARRLGMVDTLWGVVLPAIFSAWGTFMVRQFILTIPRDLDDAARLDGAGFFRVYRDIILPLIKPVVATLGIFTFLGAWNNFIWPLLMLSSTDNKTLPLGLQLFNSRQAMRVPWHQIMAASTFSVIPVLLIFILGQRYYIRGIALSGLKG